MNHKKHKTATVLLGGILLTSVLINLTRILIHNPRTFIDMFRLTKEVGMPWIPYISLAVIILPALGAAGLIKYRRWGFYAMYLSYLAGASVASFPFAPDFIFLFTSGIYKSIMTLIVITGILVLLIYLHLSGKKHGYFGKSTAS